MAEAILGAVLEQLMENVNSLIQREVHLFFGIKNDAKKLSRTLSTVLDVLEDAESRKIKEKSIANWLKMLEDVAYDASDALDEWVLETQQPAEEAELTDGGSTSRVSNSFLSCLNVKTHSFRRKMANKFKEIINKFDEIAAQRSKFHLSQVVVEDGPQFDVNRETSSTPIEPKIYGRDGDKKAIIDILLGNVNRDENVSICPIVGIGGLGKTTLAQSVYNDDRVASCFAVKIWVCVSEPFDVRRVLKAIIEVSNGETRDLHNLEAIQNKVREVLIGKRYLLVLDDVWNDNRDEWNRLKNSLMVGAKGSSIIITTRLDIVASITGTIPKYCLQPLSDDDCWSLFKNRAFIDMSEENVVLVTIGKEIIKKCKGVPLAAKSLGSLLWCKTDESHWKHIRDSEMWNLDENAENEILPALRLSYDHLRPQLKRCFASCSIYPKDHKMEKMELIHLWIANGFIQSIGGMEPEDVGDMIFNELLRRSFFQDLTEDPLFKNINCRMHDLMHDLASFVMMGDCLTMEVGMDMKHVKKLRHLSLVCNRSPPSSVLNYLFKSQPALRSLTFLSEHTMFHFESPAMDLSNLSSLKCLRALNLSNMKIETLTSSICHLKLLRYLNLSHNRIMSLPESIHGLRSLQRLDLSSNINLTTLPPSIGKLEELRYFNLYHCAQLTLLPESIGDLRNLRSLILGGCKLKVLPKTMRNITKLRRLDINEIFGVTKMPTGIGELTCLKTLNLFVVGSCDRDSDSECGGISELKNLNHLRGTLEIRGLENVSNPEEVKEANLSDKQCLTKLVLEWSRPSEGNSCTEVLEGVRPPPCLTNLRISGYPGQYLQGFLRNLTSLRYLSISNCENIKCLSMIGIQNLNNNISFLVELRLEDCKNLTFVSDGLRCQTSLQSLAISNCPELELERDDLQHLVSLERLELHDLPKVTSLPESIQHLTRLQDLYIGKCENLRRLPEGLEHLTTLKSLVFKLCPLKSISTGLRHQTSLQSLEITYCPELELATDDFQHLVSLQSLELWGLPMVTSFPDPIQHLTLLQQLKIWGCKKLRRLPESLKYLTALKYLHIYDCHPELHTRYEKEKGQDWHIISHIPKLDIS